MSDQISDLGPEPRVGLGTARPGGMDEACEIELAGLHKDPAWVVYQRYNPWVMGGSTLTKWRFPVYRYVRFEHAGVRFFVFEINPGDWDTHEESTGAFLHQSNRATQAIELTIYFLAETPDFREQIKRFGPYEQASLVDEQLGLKEARAIRQRFREQMTAPAHNPLDPRLPRKLP